MMPDKDKEESTQAYSIEDGNLEAEFFGSGEQEPQLVVTEGKIAGSKFAISKALISIGRHPDSDIFLDDITVSRTHAEIHTSEDNCEIRDKGSLNGTYVNQERMEKSILSSGDEVQIGKFKFIFLSPKAEIKKV